MIKNNDISNSRISSDKVVEELLRAYKELVPQNTSEIQHDPDCEPSYFMVAKFVSNLDKATWNKVCMKALQMGWCALEICPDSGLARMAQLPDSEFLPSPELLGHMLLATPFLQQLELEVLRALRGSTPLAVVRFAMAENSIVNMEQAVHIIHNALEKYGEVCDTLGVLDTTSFALILPGAKAFKAQNIVEDIVQNCALKSLFLHAGIVVHTGSECNIQDFLQHSTEALQQAIEKQISLYMYKKPATSFDIHGTLVQMHEKRFLFGGSDEV